MHIERELVEWIWEGFKRNRNRRILVVPINIAINSNCRCPHVSLGTVDFGSNPPSETVWHNYTVEKREDGSVYHVECGEKIVDRTDFFNQWVQDFFRKCPDVTKVVVPMDAARDSPCAGLCGKSNASGGCDPAPLQADFKSDYILERRGEEVFHVGCESKVTEVRKKADRSESYPYAGGP